MYQGASLIVHRQFGTSTSSIKWQRIHKSSGSILVLSPDVSSATGCFCASSHRLLQAYKNIVVVKARLKCLLFNILPLYRFIATACKGTQHLNATNSRATQWLGNPTAVWVWRHTQTESPKMADVEFEDQQVKMLNI